MSMRIETKFIPYGDTRIIVSYTITGDKKDTYVKHLEQWYPGDGEEIEVHSATTIDGDEIDLELLDVEFLINAY